MRLKAKRCNKLKGIIKVPGDKSITHRGLIIGAIANGKTVIKNGSFCRDCISTLNVLKKSGVDIIVKNREIIISGKGFEGLRKFNGKLDCGNSGTTMRLMSGIFSTLNFETALNGDSSLRKRPMDRIIKPLQKMGAEIKKSGEKGFPPLYIKGKSLKLINYKLEIPSAQIKSSIILAGLNTEGTTTIIEPIPSRDHTERMLEFFGASIKKVRDKIEIKGKKGFSGREIIVPADISSAAYFIALALLTDESEIIIKDTGINKTRIGFIKILQKMGAEIKIINKRVVSNELIGDISINGKQKLKGVIMDKRDIPSIIDELPLLAVVATQAEGKTVVKGAEELRVKESDRIKTITEELKKGGAEIIATKDGFILNGKTNLIGAKYESYGDHRIAMSLTIAGLISEEETIINNTECIDISFPNFINYFKELNCDGIIGV